MRTALKAPKPNSSNSSPVHVTILGTGDAFCSGGRHQSGYLIDTGRKRFLLEAGPAILATLKTHRIHADSLDVIVISHLHGDHFAGLPFLFLEFMYERPLKHQLVIAGPPRLEQRTWVLMRTMYPGFDLAQIKRKLKFVTLRPGEIQRIAGARVSAIRSPHTNPDVSLSVKLDLGSAKVVFSGDTGWNEELLDFSAGANLMICECTYYESSQFQFHINYPELRRNRDRFNVGRMILTHIGREVIERAPDIDMEVAFDGMKLEI